MPSFDIVSEVDQQEIDNALNQARKELSTRFDFKQSQATIKLSAPDVIELKAEDASRLKSLHEILIGKLAKRNAGNFAAWSCSARNSDQARTRRR